MIKRKQPLKRSSKPIARGGRPRARRPGAPRRGPANIPADEWRNEGYLEFLREQCKCVACMHVDRASVRRYLGGVSACEPMHGPPNGKSQKGPDAGAIPGCRAHHIEQTRIGWPAFEEKYGFDRETEAATHFTTYTLLSRAEA